ncbi:hypothetical protein PanWU01x14_018010 [Parasponia andersonii]|uniref:Uncharacterized protein n=1 Tax=Parasponia andersonii TaxID=3476 RepID=A0A2P5DZ20_PARAD|nr:hypothetical protein PanWU01x14_018010 [Parasponia andersonii]
MANDDISWTIDSIIQKTSSLKSSDATPNLKPDVATAENTCRLLAAFKILGEHIVSRRAIKDLISNAWHLSYS